MQPIQPIRVIAALDALGAGARTLAEAELPTLFGGVVDRAAGVRLVQRVAMDAETAVAALAEGGYGTDPTRVARRAVTMLEHASIDTIALRDLGTRIGAMAGEIRNAPTVRAAESGELLARAHHDLPPAQLRRLHDLVAAGDAAAAGVPTTLDGAPPLVDLTARAAREGTAPDELLRYAATWKVSRLDEGGRIDAARAIMRRHSADLTRGDWTELDALLNAGLTPAQLDIPAPTNGRASLRDIVSKGLAGDTPTADMQQPFERVAVQSMTPAERLAQADAIFTSRPAKLTEREWLRASWLLWTDADQAIPMPRTLNRFKIQEIAHNRGVGRDTTAINPTIEWFFDQYRVNRLPASLRQDEARPLLMRRAQELGVDERKRLAALLESDPDGTLIDVPRTFDGEWGLTTVLRKARPDESDLRLIQRYLDRAAVRQLAPEARTAQANELLGRNPDSLATSDWERLAALLDDDTDGTLITLPRKLDQTTPLATIARTNADSSSVDPRTRRYFDVFEAQQLTPEARAETVAALLRRDPATLSGDEWTRLASIAELDPTGATTGIPSKVANFDGFVRVARGNAGRDAKSFAEATDHYVEAWRVRQLSDVDQATLAERILRSNPDDVTRTEWIQLRALADANPESVAIGASSSSSLGDAALASARASKPNGAARHHFELAHVRQLDEGARAAQADELLRRDTSTLTKDDWRRLAALVEDDHDATRIAVPRVIGRTTFAQQARAISQDSVTHDTVREFFAAYVANHLPAAERAAEARALLARPMSELTREEWSRLGAIVAADADGTIPVTRTIQGISSNFVDVARANAKRSEPLAATRHYLQRYAVDQLTPAQQRAEATALLSKAPDSLTADEWARLGALLDVDATGTIVPAPRTLDDAKPLAQLARTNADSQQSSFVGVQRYFDRFQVDRMGAADRTTAAADLMSRDPKSLTKEDWARLATLLEVEGSSATPLGAPPHIDGLQPFAKVARQGATYPASAGESARHYFERVTISQLTPEARVAEATGLLARDPANLTEAQWQRLGALLDDEVAGPQVTAPRTSAAFTRQTFGQLARAGEGTRHAAQQRHFFQLAAVARMTPEARVTEANRLLAMPPSLMRDEHWARLAALIEHEPTPALQHATRQLQGITSMDGVARNLASGSRSSESTGRRYLARAAVERLSADERVALLDSHMSRRPSELTSDEWSELLAVLDADGNDELARITQLLEGQQFARNVWQQLEQPSKHASPGLRRAFDTYQVDKLPAAARRAEADELLAMRAKDLTSEQMSRLWALLKLDTDSTVVRAPRVVSGAKLTDVLFQGTNAKVHRQLQPYLDVHRVIATTTPDQLRVQARDLLTREASELTRDEWSRLATLLDADLSRTAIDVPRTIDNLPSFDQIAHDIARKYRKVDAAAERYFTAWKDANDPTYRARLAAAIDALVAGSADDAAKKMVANEWWRMEQMVAGRPVHDQAAIAMVMMGSDQQASNRGVLRSLEFARSGLADATDVPTDLEQLRAQTLELLDLNIARLKGRTPTGAVRGYSNHPDYAEIGRIRANLVFLDHARNVLPPEATAATPVEQLTW